MKSRIIRLARIGWRPGIMWFAPSTTTSGAGLGLPIVKRLVESWGATIGAANDRKGGATMTVRWPTT